MGWGRDVVKPSPAYISPLVLNMQGFPCKCMNEPQYEEIFERAFSWFWCELPVHACFNRAENSEYLRLMTTRLNFKELV